MKIFRALNPLENAEFRLDRGSKGNLNFSIISSYKGSLDEKIVGLGLRHLQKIHPLLRVSPDAEEKVSSFVETSAKVPLKVRNYEGKEQWKNVVKEELSHRFTKITEPLWRVVFLKGEQEGQIVITFHHAIADGICGMELMNHLYQVLAELSQGKIPEKRTFDKPLPPLHSLHCLTSSGVSEDLPIPPRTDKGYHTTVIKEEIDETVTNRMKEWTTSEGIRMHSMLLAALMLAVRKIVRPPHEKFNGISAINFRPFFHPYVPKGTLALLRTLLSAEFSVSKNTDLSSLAKAIHKDLYDQLKQGHHVLNLKTLEKRLERNVSPEELWHRSRLSKNAVAVSNVGALDFSGEYPNSNLKLNEVFFVANIEPFMEEPTNFVLGAVTFKGKLFLTLWFLEELVPEKLGQMILAEIKTILQVGKEESEVMPPSLSFKK